MQRNREEPIRILDVRFACIESGSDETDETVESQGGPSISFGSFDRKGNEFPRLRHPIPISTNRPPISQVRLARNTQIRLARNPQVRSARSKWRRGKGFTVKTLPILAAAVGLTLSWILAILFQVLESRAAAASYRDKTRSNAASEMGRSGTDILYKDYDASSAAAPSGLTTAILWLKFFIVPLPALLGLGVFFMSLLRPILRRRRMRRLEQGPQLIAMPTALGADKSHQSPSDLPTQDQRRRAA